MKITLRKCILASALAVSALTMAACSSGGYSDTHYSVGVTSGYRGGAYGDRDLDGIPNRYDRDRDGDGVPNRYDRRPDNPYRR